MNALVLGMTPSFAVDAGNLMEVSKCPPAV